MFSELHSQFTLRAKDRMADLSERMLPLTLDDALHVLRRTTYQPTYGAALKLVGKTPHQAISELIREADPVCMSPDWATKPPVINSFNDVAILYPKLQAWWMDRVLGVGTMKERMVMFWQNLFTSDYINVYVPHWMVKQQQLFRSNVFNYRSLATAIVGDPAMLRYLNGDISIKGRPNENFAREWFELFTLGIGNYTEADIKEAAKAFTGWRTNGLDGVYNAQLADTSQKTILGKTGNWIWSDVVSITLEHKACARHVARRILKHFVEFYPTEETVDQVAALIAKHDYDMMPVLEQVLTSEYFYSSHIRGCLIKSPAELVIGLAAVLDAQRIDRTYAIASMTKLTQEPFYPPTVEGWKGHHAWITSSTFPQRQRYAEAFIDGRQTGSSSKLMDSSGKSLVPDVVGFVRQLPKPNDAVSVVDTVARIMLPIEATTAQKNALLEIMLAGAQVYEWSIDDASSVQRIKFLLQAISRMPEFQLT